MGTLGMVLGMVLGGALVLWLGHTGFTYPGLEEMAGKFNLPNRIYPQFSAVGLLMGPVIVMLASLTASIYPALRLHWLEPVAALRAAE